MSYYICPACGSSVDAGERCSCGTRDKPVLQTMYKADHSRTRGTTKAEAILSKFTAMQQELLQQQEERKTEHIKNRKEIFKEICQKTEKSL